MSESKIIEKEILGLREVRNLDFSAFSINNRKLWDNIPDDIKSRIIGRAESIEFSKDDYISLSLFRDFKKSGNRKNFENVYFEKRKKLSALVIAECIGNEGRFISKIEEGIWALLSEPDWVLPPHNSYIRDTEQEDTPLLSRPVLDLFACETAEILALARCTLKHRLNPIIVKDVEWALYNRIVIPYTTDSFWWMGGQGPLNNWSTWCTQNCLIASLSIPLDEKTRFHIVRKASATLDAFIDDYESDGACPEGAAYYHAAALTLFSAVLLLERATDRFFQKFFKNEKIRAMASYIEDVHVAKDIYLNYADSSPKAGHLGAREYLFAKAIGNDAMMHHAATDYMQFGFEEEDNDYNLYYKLLALASYQEIKKEAESRREGIKPHFKAFPSSELAIYREGEITFAVKGGNNGESHNHNDVGSIILYRGSDPLLIDIGVETYTKTTFSRERYTLKPMQSAYHNLVNFGSLMQKDGKEYRAENVFFDETDATLDLRKAYPENEELKSYVRKIHFDRKNLLIHINEIFASSLPACLSLISQERPKEDEERLSYSSFSIAFPEKLECIIEEIPITDQRLRRAWPAMLYRTKVMLKNSTEWVISFS